MRRWHTPPNPAVPRIIRDIFFQNLALIYVVRLFRLSENRLLSQKADRMTAPIRVGILGYGFATSTFHAPLIAAVPGLQLVAISSSQGEQVRQQWPHVQALPNAQALMARQDIDLVVIPTPNDTHYDLACQALAAGKHVVVDKPFTVRSAQARDLIERAKRTDRVLSIFHNRRWDADFLGVQALLASGQLGRLCHFESHFDRFRPEVRPRWREMPEPGGGLWYDLGSHLLDQVLQLFGKPDTIALDLAVQRDQAQTDDWFHALLRYGNLRVVLHASTLSAQPVARFTLHGTQGSYCKFGLDAQEDALKAGLRPVRQEPKGPIHWGQDLQAGTLRLANEQGFSDQTLPSPAGDYTQYYAALRDALRRKGPNPVTAEQALSVIELIEAGLQSWQQGRVIHL